MFAQYSRALDPDEKRGLQGAILDLKSRMGARRLCRLLVVSFGMSAILCTGTLAAVGSGTRPGTVMAFWTAFGLLMALAVGITELRASRRRSNALRGAVQHDVAHVVRIQATAIVSLEEIEDLGACHAYQVEDEQIVFVCGQQFYDPAEFPSSDFSLIAIEGEDGDVVEELVVPHGHHLEPLRVIGLQARERMRMPEHLEVVVGRLADLETILAT